MPQQPMAKPKPQPIIVERLATNSRFSGLPISAAQRWAKSGMPVTREGRRVQTSPEELNRWLGRGVSEPVQIATETTDLSSELRRGLSYVRKLSGYFEALTASTFGCFRALSTSTSAWSQSPNAKPSILPRCSYKHWQTMTKNVRIPSNSPRFRICCSPSWTARLDTSLCVGSQHFVAQDGQNS